MKRIYAFFIVFVFVISSCQLPLFGSQNTPAVLSPTQDCGSPSLVLGSRTFRIENVNLASDGSLSERPTDSDIAYWVTGTSTNLVFVLSPTQGNLALQTSLKKGDLGTVYWKDCTVTSFTVSAIEPGGLDDPTLMDQSKAGISVLVQPDSSATGFVIKGGLEEATTIEVGTSKPGDSEILAEITLPEVSASRDGKTISITTSIRNYGQSSLTLLPDKVRLVQQDGASLSMVDSKPHLPEVIKPGEMQTIELTFPRPTTSTATLKILTVEYNIEGY